MNCKYFNFNLREIEKKRTKTLMTKLKEKVRNTGKKIQSFLKKENYSNFGDEENS